MKQIHKQRLLNVAKACRETAHPAAFTMFYFGHDCGTPACAMGNYAFRRDLQRTFILRGQDVLTKASDSDLRTWIDMRVHFGITEAETVELFDTDGCGGAETHEQAATYIEKFVVKRCMGDSA